MKLSTWLKREAIKKMFKEKKFKEILSLIRARNIGYALYKDGAIEVSCNGSQIDMHADDLRYTQEQLSEFHRCGYVKDHPSSKRPVKRRVYRVEVTNGFERLIVESTNERVQESLVNQYRAIDYIPGRTFHHKGKKVNLDTGYTGFTTSEEVKKFENIIVYDRTEDVVQLVKEDKERVSKPNRE